MAKEVFKVGDTVYLQYTNKPMVVTSIDFKTLEVECPVQFKSGDVRFVSFHIDTLTKTPYTPPPQNAQDIKNVNQHEEDLVVEFAKYALQGLLANPAFFPTSFDILCTKENVAIYARKMAEATVKELKNPTK